jgi:hypothetical protein
MDFPEFDDDCCHPVESISGKLEKGSLPEEFLIGYAPTHPSV